MKCGERHRKGKGGVPFSDRSGYTSERKITKRSARADRIEIDSRSIVATTRELHPAKKMSKPTVSENSP